MKKTSNDNPNEPFKRFSSEFISLVDGVIRDFYDEKIKSAGYPFMADMYSDIAEYCARQGKRIRPLVLLLSYFGYGGDRDNTGEIIKCAAVLEMMHAFLLIQDDIIDRSEMRRGGRALHLIAADKYSRGSAGGTVGSDIALILADVLFSNSLEIISSARIDPEIKNNFMAIFSRTYEMTAWGQILDSMYSMPGYLREGENPAEDISTLKTAYYTIFYPMLMGYVLTGRTIEEESDRIEAFSLPLGLAFQIRDDILGTFGQVKETGKSADSDIEEGKLTCLIQGVLDSMHDAEREEFLAVFMKTDKSDTDVDFVRRKIIDTGALDKTRARHAELLEGSTAGLAGLQINDESRDVLMSIISLVGTVKPFIPRAND